MTAGLFLVAFGAVAVVVAYDGTEDDSPIDVSSTPGCSSAASTTSSTTTSSTTTSSTTTTTANPTTTIPSEPLGPGASGADVADLEQRLWALHYWVGTVDDVYDDDTLHAVTAFEKVNGFARDGIADADVRLALQTATPAAPRSDEGDLIEIDVTRQVLFVVQDGRTEWVLDTSTGKPSTPTAIGRFEIEREIDGYHRATLGVLYRPKYFHGGQALHGFPDVPPQPASHGCVRLTNHSIDWLWDRDLAPIGTPVWVYAT